MKRDEALKFLAKLREDRISFVASLKADGSYASMGEDSALGFQADDEKLYGMASYLLDHEVAQFKTHLENAALCRCKILRGYESGHPIDSSYVAIGESEGLWCALAAGAFPLAIEIAQLTGGRDEIEKANDYPFFLALGYCLKGVILDDSSLVDKWISIGEQEANRKRFRNFVGVLHGLKAISDRDRATVELAIGWIREDYQRECRPSSQYFENPIHKLLCVHGVGFVNLARWKGLSAAGFAPLIPEDLLVPAGGSD